MLKFSYRFKDYELYNDSQYHMKDVPREIKSALHGIINRYCKTTEQLKVTVNTLYSYVPCEGTGNWGRNYLENDLSDAIWKFSDSKFPRFMDAIFDIAVHFGSGFIDDINELFKEYHFGYYLDKSFFGWEWVLRDDKITATESIINQSVKEVKDICTQTQEHLIRIKDNLKIDTLRSKKDAVRDAMSAMESFLKNLSNTNDIKDAIHELRSQKKWGNDEIIKDGIAIWGNLHRIHPDIRHGSPIITDMDDEEALYWIERIITYINYLIRKRKTLN